jgi:hypothetical protein
MINILKSPRKMGGLAPWLILTLLVSSLMPNAAEAGSKYKKSTVIDFEGALVEGKSRKPYSAYLTQQKDSAYGELHRWQPDFEKRLLDSQTRLDKLQ